jgi:hypothetical protein
VDRQASDRNAILTLTSSCDHVGEVPVSTASKLTYFAKSSERAARQARTRL